jgi:hypothetical protein
LVCWRSPSTFGAGRWQAILSQQVCGRVGWWFMCQQAGWQVAVAWWWQPACSFGVLWHWEAFHRPGVPGAKVSGLPCAFPQPRVSPASQPGPWFMELTQSASVSQSSFWSLNKWFYKRGFNMSIMF